MLQQHVQESKPDDRLTHWQASHDAVTETVSTRAGTVSAQRYHARVSRSNVQSSWTATLDEHQITHLQRARLPRLSATMLWVFTVGQACLGRPRTGLF